MKIYVGNLSFETTVEQLRALFAKYGEVQDVALALDKETNKPRGFGFVFMPEEAAARSAIAALNRFRFQGRPIHVSEPRKKGELPPPKPSRPSRGPSRGYRGGGGGGGGYGGGGDRPQNRFGPPRRGGSSGGSGGSGGSRPFYRGFRNNRSGPGGGSGGSGGHTGGGSGGQPS